MHNTQRRMWKPGIIFVVCFTFLLLFPLYAHAQETDQKVTIYGLGSKEGEIISIPDNLPKSYQIPAGGGKSADYRVVSGESAKVSEDGLVTPKYKYWKKYPGYSVSVQEGQEYDYYTLTSGDTRIVVNTADGIYNITVSVADYKITYGDEVMDTYIKENITDTMTDREIMEAVARFPASYDYSASYSNVYSMILYGGGDCWASTSAITTLCEKMGIKAWARNGNKDPGAGSGHMNAMAELNQTYYVLEAGYSMDKQDGYRPYDVTVRESLFSYYISSGSITIYQYDGYETSGTLTVPETIDGKTVTKIAASAFAGKEFSEIKLPDTLAEIGDFAFSGCKEMTHMEIPASVSVIGLSIFADCEKLMDLSVAEANAEYKAEGGAIYSKDGSTLVTCPNAGEVVIPSTVTKIADYAFYYNGNLTRIVIPESVTELEEAAFGNCESLTDVRFEGDSLTRIGTHCFRSDSEISVIRIPSSVKSIGAYAFYFCNHLKHIYFMGDAPEFGETIDDTFYDRVFQGCTVNAYYLEGNDTWTAEKLGNHDGTVTWQTWKGMEGTSIEQAVLTLEQDRYTYTGAYITPGITLRMGQTALKENEDYVVVYDNNRDAGTASTKIVGIGSYYGELSAEFVIAKAKQDIRIYVRKHEIEENSTTEIYYIILNGVSASLSDCTYTSSNPSVAVVDSDGVIKGVGVGTTDIIASAAETDNYLASSTSVRITVTSASSADDKDDPGNKGNQGNNNPTDDGRKVKYYDKKTGLTVLTAGNGKREVTLTAVDKKHARGTFVVPASIKINGKSYKITSIGKNALKNQKQLKKVTLGKYTKTIGENAFSGCARLQSVTIGKNVTTIGNKAFYKCTKLQKITIPANVKKIGKSAFYGCKNMKNITIQSKKLTSKTVGSRAFQSIYKKAVVKVPKSKLSAYKKLLKSKGAGTKVKVKR